MAYLPQTPLRQQHQRATQHARRQSWAGHLHPSAVTPSYLNPYHHTNGVLPYVWASTPTFSVPRPLGMPLQQSPLFLSGAATSAIMQPATYAHLQNAPAKHHRRSFSVASPGLHHRPNPGPGGPLMPLSSRGTFGLEQSTSASRPGRRPLHSRSQSTSSLRSLHSFQQGGPSLLGGNLPAQTRLQRAMDWTPRILPDKLPEFKQVRLTPDMVRDKHNGYTYLMSLQSGKNTSRSRTDPRSVIENASMPTIVCLLSSCPSFSCCSLACYRVSHTALCGFRGQTLRGKSYGPIVPAEAS